jgi:hypothetical protein
MPRQFWLYSLAVLVFLWCVCLPFVATYNWAHLPPFNYSTSILMFRPDLVAAASVFLCLPFALHRSRASGRVFVGIGLALPLLALALGTAGDIWPVSTALLLLFGWRLLARSATQV